MSRRKRPVVVQLENGEFEFGPNLGETFETPPLKLRKLDVNDNGNAPHQSSVIPDNVFQRISEKEKLSEIPSQEEVFSQVQNSNGQSNSSTSGHVQSICKDDLLLQSEQVQSKNVVTLVDDNDSDFIEIVDDVKNSSSYSKRVLQPVSTREIMVIDDEENVNNRNNYDVVSIEDDGEYDNNNDLVEIITPENEILTVFPDADLNDVNRLLQLYQNQVDLTVQHMIEKGYLKIEKRPAEKPTVDGVQEQLKNIDFSSTAWTPTAEYEAHAINELINNYPFIRVESIHKVFKMEKNHYYHTIKSLETKTGIPPVWDFREEFQKNKIFPLLLIGKIRSTLEENGSDEIIKTRFSTKSLPTPITKLNSILDAEIKWMRKQRKQELEQKDKAIAEELNYKLASDENALMECGCCYAEYPFEQLVQCTEAHLFCKQCLQRYAEQTLFGDGRSTLKCMCADGEPCPGVFTESMLRASLPEKVLAKFSEAQTRDVLKAAKIDLVTCYECQYQVSMAEDAGKVMHCPQCGNDTCRECGEEAHIPLKCSEVEKKGDTAKRLTVEEALTQARVRTCPQCKTRFYKTEGCNKMTCSCGINICYICRKNITKEKYQHFCQTPHCNHANCGRCLLYTDSVQDDIQAMREAGLKAIHDVHNANDANESTTRNEKSTENINNIDLNKYLEAAPKGTKPVTAAEVRAAIAGNLPVARVGPRALAPQMQVPPIPQMIIPPMPPIPPIPLAPFPAPPIVPIHPLPHELPLANRRPERNKRKRRRYY